MHQTYSQSERQNYMMQDKKAGVFAHRMRSQSHMLPPRARPGMWVLGQILGVYLDSPFTPNSNLQIVQRTPTSSIQYFRGTSSSPTKAVLQTHSEAHTFELTESEIWSLLLTRGPWTMLRLDLLGFRPPLHAARGCATITEILACVPPGTSPGNAVWHTLCADKSNLLSANKITWEIKPCVQTLRRRR